MPVATYEGPKIREASFHRWVALLAHQRWWQKKPTLARILAFHRCGRYRAVLLADSTCVHTTACTYWGAVETTLKYLQLLYQHRILISLKASPFGLSKMHKKALGWALWETERCCYRRCFVPHSRKTCWPWGSQSTSCAVLSQIDEMNLLIAAYGPPHHSSGASLNGTRGWHKAGSGASFTTLGECCDSGTLGGICSNRFLAQTTGPAMNWDRAAHFATLCILCFHLWLSQQPGCSLPLYMQMNPFGFMPIGVSVGPGSLSTGQCSLC